MADRYTKFVLTIIAASLAIIAFRDIRLVTNADAESPMHVIVDKADNFAFQFAGPMEVKMR
jgi:hypothetical protein